MENILSQISKYKVYQFHHIDLLKYIWPVSSYLYYSSKTELNIIVNAVKKRFIEAGWEGDGEIGIIWLPPFLKFNDTGGEILWHVKQQNNGTSWIASPINLYFDPIIDENSELFELGDVNVYDNIDPTPLIRNYKERVEEFLHFLVNQKNKLEDYFNNKSKYMEELLITFQNSTQCQLEYIFNDLYLYFLLIQFKLNPERRNIIKKNRTLKIDLDKYSDPESDEESIYSLLIGNAWRNSKFENFNDLLSIYIFLTKISYKNEGDMRYRLIRDIWNNFKFKNFSDKLSFYKKLPIIKSEETLLDIIEKHRVIRNYYQHHDGYFIQTRINKTNNKEIIILDDNCSKIKIKKDEKIPLTIPELLNYIFALENLFNIFLMDADKILLNIYDNTYGYSQTD